jgi:acyl carrier protein
LDAFPLTSTGKVDHRSLPVPDQIRPELKQVFVAPRTEIEKALAEIWAKVLKLQQIGIHDSFFDLGGHSLLATRVVSRIRSLFDADLTLRAFFERPTVADLAATIAQNVAEKTDLEEITRALRDIQALSNEETARQLAEETRSSEQSPPADSE